MCSCLSCGGPLGADPLLHWYLSFDVQNAIRSWPTFVFAFGFLLREGYWSWPKSPVFSTCGQPRSQPVVRNAIRSRPTSSLCPTDCDIPMLRRRILLFTLFLLRKAYWSWPTCPHALFLRYARKLATGFRGRADSLGADPLCAMPLVLHRADPIAMSLSCDEDFDYELYPLYYWNRRRFFHLLTRITLSSSCMPTASLQLPWLLLQFWHISRLAESLDTLCFP